MAKLPSHLGIDLGTKNIKIVYFENPDKPSLTLLKTINLPNPGLNNYLPPATEQTGKLLATAIKELNPPTQYVAFSIPEANTFTQFIKIPKVSPDELPEAVYWQLQKILPQSVENFKRDFVIVNEDKQHNLYNILTVAVPNKTIENYMSVIKAAGLTPVAIEPEMFAITRTVIANYKIKDGLLLDIGANTTNIGIITNNQLASAQNIAFGAEEIMQVIKQGLNLTTSQAQEYQQNNGIETALQDEKLSGMLRPILTQFTTELLRILEFVRKTVHIQPNVNNMYLAGGGAKIKGLSTYLQKNFEIDNPPTILNPFNSINVPKSINYLKTTPYPEFAVSVGLALKTE